jgi:hypothetical protein
VIIQRLSIQPVTFQVESLFPACPEFNSCQFAQSVSKIFRGDDHVASPVHFCTVVRDLSLTQSGFGSESFQVEIGASSGMVSQWPSVKVSS